MVKNVLKSLLVRQSNTYYVLIILGTLVFCTGTIARTVTASKQPTVSASAIDTTSNYYWPLRIIFPKLKVVVPVVEGGIENQQWVLSEDSGHYLSTSGRIGEGFNTIVYAHRRPELFAGLEQLEVGDSIIVSTEINQAYIYIVAQKISISPSQTDALYTDEPNTLTLFTCDGIADTKRLVIRATLAH